MTRCATALGASCLLLAACTQGREGNFGQPTRSLEIMSWWTSGSESAALEVLVARFEKDAPGVRVESAAVKGGAGANVQVALARRLREHDPPDVWQTFAGASLRANAEAGRIADLSAVLDKDGLAGTIPAPILDALTWNDKRWGVPTGAHRENMLWFNIAVLKKADVAPPAAGFTAAKLFAALAALKAGGVTPLCLGAKDRFTITELFENILLSDIGTRGWADIAADRFDWQGEAVRKALAQLGQMLDQADTSAALTWDEAAKRLAAGKCAFLSMNDSVYGELVASGAAASDIGSTPYPGTDDAFLAVVDTFVVARGAKNGANALSFAALVGSASTELAFAKVKGSVPLRKDVDASALPPHQRETFEAMATKTILLSITHGELLAPPVQQAFYDGVAAFAQSRDPKAFTDRFRRVAASETPTGY